MYLNCTQKLRTPLSYTHFNLYKFFCQCFKFVLDFLKLWGYNNNMNSKGAVGNSPTAPFFMKIPKLKERFDYEY